MTDVQIQNMGRAIYEREIAMTKLRAERDALRAALQEVSDAHANYNPTQPATEFYRREAEAFRAARTLLSVSSPSPETP